MSKVDYYKTVMLPLSEVFVDSSYQWPLQSKRALRIAEKYEPIRMQPIDVGYRVNEDRYAIIDGQHRVEALRILKIGKVAARVITFDDVQEEARVFCLQSENRVAPSAYYKFRASVVAGSAFENEVTDWLTALGFKMAPTSADNHTIAFCNRLIKTYGLDRHACKESLLLQKSLLKDSEALDFGIHCGLWYLFRADKLHKVHINILRTRYSKEVLLRETRSGAAIATGDTNRAYAAGIINLLNATKGIHKTKHAIVP